MVTEKNNSLTSTEYWAIHDAIGKTGCYVHDYVRPPKTIVTDVCCPKCSEKLMYTQAGISYQITCSTDGCVDFVVRGI